MTENKNVTWFLSENTEIDCDFCWLISSAADYEKSEFLKILLGKFMDLGYDLECFYDEFDEDILRAIYLLGDKKFIINSRDMKMAETEKFGLDYGYFDLGKASELKKIQDISEEISVHFISRDEFLRQAKLKFSAVEALILSSAFYDRGQKLETDIIERAKSTAKREFIKNKADRKPKITKRQLSAYTANDRKIFTETLETYCERLIFVDNEYGLAEIFMETLVEEAESFGMDMLICYSPLVKTEIEAVIFPEIALGFYSFCKRTEIEFQNSRHIRLDAMIEPTALAEDRQRLRQDRKLAEMLIESAQDELKTAKKWHEKIDRGYKLKTDEKCLESLSEEFILVM